MDKTINIVYDALPTPQIQYEGPEGTIWYSNKRNDNCYNIYMSACHNPNPDDSYIMTEPIVAAPWQYNINYLSKFRKVFGCFDRAFIGTAINDKYIPINYGTEINQVDADQLRSTWLPWNQRKPGIVIMAGDKSSKHHASIYALRLMIADFFYKSKFEVAWYGPSNCNRPYYKGHIANKISKINEYQFHLCSENTYDEIYSYNYLTEKLPQGIYGGAVPLYIGCYNIDELAPPQSFFDLRNFVKYEHKTINLLRQPLLRTIMSFNKNNFEQYQDTAYKYIKDPMGLFYHVDMKRFFCKMLNEYFPEHP
jgi:hypothetical protein